jgi:hypothetical protein
MRANPNRAGFRWFLEIALCFLTGGSAPTAIQTIVGAPQSAEIAAVYSQTSKEYVHAQNPDGSFEPETYVLENGGNFGGPRYDPTQNKLSFEDVSRVVAKALATQNYVPSEVPATTDLVILVYWGTTIVSDDVNPKKQKESVALMEQTERTPESDFLEKGRRRTQAADFAQSEANIAPWLTRGAQTFWATPTRYLEPRRSTTRKRTP